MFFVALLTFFYVFMHVEQVSVCLWAYFRVFVDFRIFLCSRLARGLLWDALGAFWGTLGVLLGALGALLGALGALLGRSWGPLGAVLGLSCKKYVPKNGRYHFLGLQLGRQNGGQNH